MHGVAGAVQVGRRKVELLPLAQELPRGLLTSKVLHFGSCSVLENPKERKELRAAFGVRALTGFTEDVDWFESMAFELLLFDVLARYKRMDAAERFIKDNFQQLLETSRVRPRPPVGRVRTRPDAVPTVRAVAATDALRVP
jgi:hypothetical protein